MKEPGYFAYIRVSKQARAGEEGVSLAEQKAEIEDYAHKNGLLITEWFEEVQTAASRGRPIFTRMIARVRRGEAAGLLMHKIDRGTRNYSDWHALGEMIDRGIDVHFCHESLDMTSRGGRLAADMMVVIATDYIRNLRDETKKGIRGRLRQGLYPLQAPVGYLDTGRGKVKALDPERAPLVRHAFTRYASGSVSLRILTAELNAMGFRNKRGGTLSVNGLSNILNNPFYAGVMRMKRSGECHAGLHEPIIDAALFERVQALLEGRTQKHAVRHDFEFRGLIRCGGCGYTLTGEFQKGHIYYRCHQRGCEMKTVREEAIRTELKRALGTLDRTPEEQQLFENELMRMRVESTGRQKEQLAALRLNVRQVEARLRQIIDLLLDGALERTDYDRMRQELLLTKRSHEDRIGNLKASATAMLDQAQRHFELSNMAYKAYDSSDPLDKREMLLELTSNRTAFGKDVVVELRFPYADIAECLSVPTGCLQRDTVRTFVVSLMCRAELQAGQEQNVRPARGSIHDGGLSHGEGRPVARPGNEGRI